MQPVRKVKSRLDPFTFILLLIFLFSCRTVPITGRKQLSLVSPDSVRAMSFNAYSDFLSKHMVIRGTPEAKMVKRVGKRIQTAVERYFAERNMSDHLKGYKWEFNLIQEDTVNAWAMPGGKVVFYTGILPIAENEQGIAVVMGHEVAHAIAGHGRERMSQGLLVQMGGIALSVALAEKPKETQSLFFSAYGLGSQVGLMLPFSRLHESEADHMGLIFMAMAGYDPQVAVSFWQKMSKAKGGKAPPEFLSTHPSDRERIRQIKKLLPEALAYYSSPDK